MARASSEMQPKPESVIHDAPIVDEHDSEKAASGKGDFEPAPDGGIAAWLAAAGGATIFFCCLGFSNAFGTFQEYYMTHQLSDRSPDDIAWIGSLAAFFQFAIGMVAGPMFDRYGAMVKNTQHSKPRGSWLTLILPGHPSSSSCLCFRNHDA